MLSPFSISQSEPRPATNIRCALYSTVTSANRKLVLHFTNTHSERRKYRKHFAFLTEVKGFILLLCRYNLHCLFTASHKAVLSRRVFVPLNHCGEPKGTSQGYGRNASLPFCELAAKLVILMVWFPDKCRKITVVKTQ